MAQSGDNTRIMTDRKAINYNYQAKQAQNCKLVFVIEILPLLSKEQTSLSADVLMVGGNTDQTLFL